MEDLILGTAFFSPGYGIANSNEKVDVKAKTALIQSALNLGLRRFDTAPSYGDAEKVLGSLKQTGEDFRVSTKVSIDVCKNPKKLQRSIFESMEKLQVSEIDVLYLHNEKTLLEENPRLLLDELERLKSKGVYRKLGVSIYTSDILQILRREFKAIDVFQVPENICDRRLSNSCFAQELMFDNHEYIVRSVFLQGLLLMNENQIPLHLSQTKPAIERLRYFAKANHVSVVDLCLSYARGISWCDSILVGATSPTELEMIVRSKFELPLGWENEIPRIQNQFIDPRYWN